VGTLLKQFIKDVVCSDEELEEAILLGEWEQAEESEYSQGNVVHTANITLSHYNGKTYILNSKINVRKL